MHERHDTEGPPLLELSSSVKLGNHESYVQAKVLGKVTQDLRVFIKGRLGMLDSTIGVGGVRTVIDENNKVSCQLMMGTMSGLSLKLKYMYGRFFVFCFFGKILR